MVMSQARVCVPACHNFCFFFFSVTAPSEIYTLSLHDALPILQQRLGLRTGLGLENALLARRQVRQRLLRSEEHTSELQSRPHLVCRLLLEKKKESTRHRNRRVIRFPPLPPRPASPSVSGGALV